MRTGLVRPPLGPVRSTIATARVVKRIDAMASGILWACWFVINAALFVAVWIVLAAERWRRAVADPLPTGWTRDADGWVFRCPWCGTTCLEGECYVLTCCAMAGDEWLRNHLASRA